MSVDSDSGTGPSSSRDWYFPSPPFLHTNAKSPKYHRRFSTNPRPSQPDSQKPVGGLSSPNLVTPPFRGTSAPQTSFNHERLRRRVDFSRRREKPPRNDVNVAISTASDAVSKKRSEAVSGDTFISGPGFKLRWKMAFSVAVLPLPVFIIYVSIYIHRSSNFDNCVCA